MTTVTKPNQDTGTDIVAFEPSPQQEAFAKSLANLADHKSYKQKGTALGIPESTTWNWMQDNSFVAYMNEMIPVAVAAQKAMAYGKLIEKVEFGNDKALKLFFEVTGEMKREPPQHNTQINIYNNQTLLDKAKDIKGISASVLAKLENNAKPIDITIRDKPSEPIKVEPSGTEGDPTGN